MSTPSDFSDLSVAFSSILDLSYDIVLHLFTFLAAQDIVHLLSTTRALHLLMGEEFIWKELSGRHGVDNTTCFGDRSFYTVYTRMLHTYAPLLGIWAGDHPFSGNVVEFCLTKGHHPWPGCIVGWAWHFPTLEAEDSYESYAPDLPERVPVVRIAFPDQVLPDFPPSPAANAQTFCCLDCSVANDWHCAALNVVAETTQGIFLHTRHGLYKHPDFPSQSAAQWLDSRRTFPRLKVIASEVVDQSEMFHKKSRPRVPELFTAPTDQQKPMALSITCLRNCQQSGSSLLGFRNRHAERPRYYPLRSDIVMGIEPSSDSWRPRSLVGLWLGVYGQHGTECVYLDWDEPRQSLTALKITGDEHVPRGAISFDVYAGGPYTVPPEEQEVCARALIKVPDGYRLFRGAATISALGFQPHERNTLPVILAIVGSNHIRLLWLDDEDQFVFVRY